MYNINRLNVSPWAEVWVWFVPLPIAITRWSINTELCEIKSIGLSSDMCDIYIDKD